MDEYETKTNEEDIWGWIKCEEQFSTKNLLWILKYILRLLYNKNEVHKSYEYVKCCMFAFQ